MVFVHRITPTAVILLTMGLATAMPATSTLAAENFGTRVPSVEEIKRGLTGTPDSEGPKMRGLAIGGASKVTAKPSISMQVKFDFDSDKISTTAAETLNNLAKALQSEGLKVNSFDVIGHTDSKGTPSYNVDLSRRRAASVKAYLIKNGVEAQRLRPIGKGMSEPLNKNDPQAAENRRVEIAVGS